MSDRPSVLVVCLHDAAGPRGPRFLTHLSARDTQTRVDALLDELIGDHR